MFLVKNISQSAKSVFGLGYNILRGCLAPPSQTIGSIYRVPGQLSHPKNDLHIAPILLIFIYLETYFLLMNPTCTFGVFPDKQISQLVQSVFRLGDNILRGCIAPSSQTIGSLLKIPGLQSWPEKDLHIAPNLLVFIDLETYF